MRLLGLAQSHHQLLHPGHWLAVQVSAETSELLHINAVINPDKFRG